MSVDRPIALPASRCGEVNETDKIGLRVGAIFAVLITSLVGTLFPIITKRTARLRAIVPGWVFEFGKFFGSGVILATAIVHLMDPAIKEIGIANTYAYGGCLSDEWGEYPYPVSARTMRSGCGHRVYVVSIGVSASIFAICMSALFVIFVLEIVALRVGKTYLARHGIETHTDRTHHVRLETELGQSRDGSMELPTTQALGTSPGPSPPLSPAPPTSLPRNALVKLDDESTDSFWRDSSESSPAGAQILGVAILEFGILFHSLIIGMTLSLAAPQDFITLFVVIIFHQMFEGIGLGTRLAFLQLPESWQWVPLFGGILYSAITPVGMAIGLGARSTLSMSTSTASIASGILDSVSAGVLLYAATVELMAHEFIFNPYYHNCSWKRLNFVLGSFAAGAGLMALLGKWA